MPPAMPSAESSPAGLYTTNVIGAARGAFMHPDHYGFRIPVAFMAAIRAAL